ncbi:MAG: hypothetical protein HUU01_02285 [Saprospiraceae bacterium]|nr:hypothetical protein [Saprospiraceae bacterium]
MKYPSFTNSFSGNNKPGAGSLLLLLLPVFLILSCEKRETEPLDLDFGYEYYPLELGQVREYAVDSIIFDPALGGTRIDSNSWLVQEVVVDTFPGQDGLTWYRIERFQRQSDTLPWQIGKVYAAARSKQQAFRTEDNLKFIKMTFPLQANETWDGNAFFSIKTTVEIAGEQIEMFKDWAYRTLSLTDPLQVGDLTFEKVCSIQLADSENIIEYRQAKEHYAKNIGLVYKELQILDTQCVVCCNGDFGTCASTGWGQKAEKGFIVRQRLLRWQ